MLFQGYSTWLDRNQKYTFGIALVSVIVLAR